MILTEELWTVQSYIELFSNGCPTNLRPTICPHCQEAVMLHKHGSFKRTVYTLLEAFIISVYRFKCIECGRATSLLPNFVMEHHQVAWDVKEEVIRQHLSGVALVKIAEDLETSAGKLSVGVKKQKENGRNPDKNRKEKREYVHNTIAHVEKGNNRYILNGSSSEQVLKLLLAFLLHNGLLNGHNLLFFVDGARSLQAAILTMFQWLPHVRLILDWYHLKKKCEYELSLVLKGSKIRNAVLERLLPILWLGKVDVAINFVRTIDPKKMKIDQSVERLVGYFERNRDNIPCYALRRKLGLRNSSNKGEKANDLCVASRQKHNGMSWSKQGSVALTTVTTMHINHELGYWYSQDKIEFKLAS